VIQKRRRCSLTVRFKMEIWISLAI
jgi:hypothetical protein